MPEIDPSATPVSAEELQRDALATGADPEAPPLVEAENATAGGRHGGVDGALTDLPPG